MNIPRDLTMSAPDITDLERRLVSDVLSGSVLSGGPLMEQLERGIAQVSGRSHAIAVSSGTAGLHLAVRSLGIAPGQKVLTTAFSFVASVNCFLYEGAEPVFADIDPMTYNLDPNAVEIAASRQDIAAILAVDVFGQLGEIERLEGIASALGRPLIEDACEAVGAIYRGRPAGSFGKVAVFAFYPNKQMTTGEGGVVVTDDDAVAIGCRSLRNQGRGDAEEWLTHVRLGYNYRMDELSAALGVAQLQRLEDLLRKREAVAARYMTAIQSVPGASGPFVHPTTTRMSWFVYVVTLDEGIDRAQVMTDLKAVGVATRPYFRPIHLQPYFVERFGDLRGSLPVTEAVGRRTLALPFHSNLSDESIGYVCNALRRAIERQG